MYLLNILSKHDLGRNFFSCGKAETIKCCEALFDILPKTLYLNNFKLIFV